MYEMLAKVREDSGIGKTISILPTKRLIQNVRTNKDTCTVTANTPGAINNSDLIESFGVNFEAGILPRAGVAIRSYQDLKGLTIAVPLGIKFDETFSNDDTLNKIRPVHFVNAVDMLMHKRVDAVAGNIAVFRYLAKQQGIGPDKLGLPLILKRLQLYLSCNKGMKPTLRSRLKNSVKTLRDRGAFKKIERTYFDNKD